MSKALTCVFTVPAFGVTSSATLATALGNVPIDSQFTRALALSVISDTTTTVAGPPPAAQRTIVLGLGPGLGNPGAFNGTAATVTANIQQNLAGNPAGPPGPAPIASYTLTGDHPGGFGYIRPPYLQITDSGGTGSGALAYAQMGVALLGGVVVTGAMTAPYTAATVVTASGGELAPGGTQATFSVTIVGGSITAITPLTTGGPYNSPPKLTITDTGGGAGQGAVAMLGITKVVPVYAGVDYTTPIVTVVPAFKANTPDADAAAQIAAVQGFMQLILAEALGSGVQTTVPVVS